MSHTFFMSSLRDLFYLLEARDEFFIQTFGQKLVVKVKTDIGNNMQMPADLTRQLQAEGDLPPENRIVQWFISKDPMEGKASQWLITQYLRGFFQLEDIDHVVGLINEFVAKRARNELEIKDLGQYKTVAQLETAVGMGQAAADDTPETPDENIPPQILEQMEVLKNNANVFIAKLKTQDAAIFAGSVHLYGSLNKNKQTRWCTAYTREQNRHNHFNTYNPQGPLIVVIIKRGPDAGKYQFHFESNQFKDAEDIEIRNLRAWLMRNEDARQILAPLATRSGKLEFLSKEDFMRARQQLIAAGSVKQLLDGTKYDVLWIKQEDYKLQAMLTGDAVQYQNKANKLAQRDRGPYGNGIFIILDKKTLSYATYKLGYASILKGDMVGYPARTFFAANEEVGAIFKQLRNAESTDDTPKTSKEEQHEQLINSLVEAGAVKQIYKTKNITTWWFKDLKTYVKYFGDMSSNFTINTYERGEMYKDAGILLFDNGEQMYAYRCGDKSVVDVDTHRYEAGQGYHNSTPVEDFIRQNKDSRDILQRYADRFQYFPLMSSKARLGLYQDLVSKGALKIINEENPRVIQILSPDALPIMLDAMQAASSAGSSVQQLQSGITKEMKQGEVYTINDTMLFIPRAHVAWSAGVETPQDEIKGLFTRYPTLSELLKPVLLKYGIPEAKLDLKETVPEMVRAGNIAPISASPLTFQLLTPAGITWFVRHHLQKKTIGEYNNRVAGAWTPTGFKDPATVMLTTDNSSAPAVKIFGTLIKGTTPLLIFVRKTGAGGYELTSAVFDKNAERITNPKNTNHTGTVAYLQKFPDLIKAIAPHLSDIDEGWADVFRTLGGVNKTDAAGNQVAASEGYTKALHAVSNMLAAAKTNVNARAGEEQVVSDTNIEKFTTHAKKTAAALKASGPSLTDTDAKKIAKHINEVLKFVSNRSYRPVPKELAEWLKHATEVTPQTKLQIILDNPTFIAGIEHPPVRLFQAIYDKRVEKDIHAARIFANIDDETEQELDNELMRNNNFYGVRWKTYAAKYPLHATNPNRNRTNVYQLRDVPLNVMRELYNGARNGKTFLKNYDFPTEEVLMWVLAHHPHDITNTSLVSEKRTPKFRAAYKFWKQNNTLNGFVYTPPVERPVVAQPERPARQPRQAAAGAGAAGAAPRGPAEGFATKAEHARHIIANRTADDNRQSLIRKLIDDVGLTPAGAATYYYNLTRAAVAEGEEDLSFFKASLRSLFG